MLRGVLDVCNRVAARLTELLDVLWGLLRDVTPMTQTYNVQNFFKKMLDFPKCSGRIAYIACNDAVDEPCPLVRTRVLLRSHG